MIERGKATGWRAEARRKKKVNSQHWRPDSALQRRPVSVTVKVKDKAMGPSHAILC